MTIRSVHHRSGEAIDPAGEQKMFTIGEKVYTVTLQVVNTSAVPVSLMGSFAARQ